jgi:hypothetical protein
MNSKLGAFAIARRSIALAIFSGQELECWQVRILPNDEDQAKTATAAFVRWALDHFHFSATAIQSGELETHRKEQLRDLACEVLRENGIPILVATEDDLFRAFRNPSLTRRADLRKLIHQILPQLAEQRETLPLLDAAALGLYIKTEHLLTLTTQDQ